MVTVWKVVITVVVIMETFEVHRGLLVAHTPIKGYVMTVEQKIA